MIRPRSARCRNDAGIAVLRGNLAPDGAVIKPAAASPHLLNTAAARWSSTAIEDMHARIDDPDLDVDADSVLVLRGCGPRGYPGHARGREHAAAEEAARAGRARHGPHLRRAHERHRVRHGRAARHARGRRRGPLALVRTGDIIALDVEARRLDLDVPAEELMRRSPDEKTLAAYANPERGWERLYVDHVLQADKGADLDFLVGRSGSSVSRESH